VRRDRRECRKSVWEGKFQNGRTVKCETIQQQEGRETGGWGA
jgi:hypothetical protein